MLARDPQVAAMTLETTSTAHVRLGISPSFLWALLKRGRVPGAVMIRGMHGSEWRIPSSFTLDQVSWKKKRMAQ